MSPEALHIELLHSCRMRCRACDHRLLGGARLKTADLRRVFSMPELKGLRLVSFSGGEPLLYPGLAAALKKAAAAFPAARLVLLSSLYDTSGALRLLRSLPPPLLARLHLGSSLDGSPQMHDVMRGRPGAFAALKASLTAIKREFPSLSAGLTFTATRLNAAVFYEAWEQARALGVPLLPQFLVPNQNTAGLELDERARVRMAAGLRRVLRRRPEGAAELRQALDFISGGPTGPCGAGLTFLMLSPEAEFYLCPLHKEIRAPLNRPAALRPAGPGYRSRHCAGCFLRCAR